MSHKIDNSIVPAIGIGLGIVGLGSIITAIFASKVPILRNMNPKALTAIRVTLGLSGAAEMIAGLAFMSYTMRNKGSALGPEEPEETDSSTDEDSVSSNQPPPQASVSSDPENSISSLSSSSSNEPDRNPVSSDRPLPQASSSSETEDSTSTSSTSSGDETVSSEGEPKPSTPQEAFVKAVTDGDRAEAERLLNEGGVDINGTATYEARQLRLLTIAICKGEVEIIELLLSQEGILTSSDLGAELYVWAQRSGQIGVIRPLLEAGVIQSSGAQFDSGFVIWVLYNNGKHDLIPLLLDCGFELDVAVLSPDYRLCQYFYNAGNSEGFKALVEAGVRLDFLHKKTDKRGDELRSWAFAQLGIEEQAGISSPTNGEKLSGKGAEEAQLGADRLKDAVTGNHPHLVQQ